MTLLCPIVVEIQGESVSNIDVSRSFSFTYERFQVQQTFSMSIKLSGGIVFI
jgi:hypothetical protein